MNTLSLTQKLNTLVANFEWQCGRTIPAVTPVLDLYREYCDWSELHHQPIQGIDEFLLQLTLRNDCIPCRLPDGSVAVLGIALKMARGVVQ
ncbi:hypothetical protein [Rhodoferax sp.]|uniref:hypothetical protein n=1 Tax=Rhodoferax sp. TaxID=50421 RepID=UPI0019F0AC84|nr:hypothetical protein [Rhodoferax sp.]MBE0474809.1 hypothetical protein [Rhodoferax sp.]